MVALSVSIFALAILVALICACLKYTLRKLQYMWDEIDDVREMVRLESIRLRCCPLCGQNHSGWSTNFRDDRGDHIIYPYTEPLVDARSGEEVEVPLD